MQSINFDWINTHLARAAWAQVWQVTVLILVVAVAAKLLTRNRPHLAYVLWLVVLAKCVTPPLWNSPSGLFCWLQPGRTESSGRIDPAFAAASSAAVEHWRPEVVVATSDDGSSQGGSSQIAAITKDLKNRSRKAPQDAPIQERPNKNMTDQGDEAITVFHARVGSAASVLLTVWLGGVAVIFVISVARVLVCIWLAMRGGRPADAALEALVEKLARRLRLARRPRVWITANRVGPAVVGLFRPIILLPEAVAGGKSPEELAPILAHELIHLRRGDLWFGMLQVTAQGLWWFHPLVWLANRWASREAERCCDEEVVAELGCEPARYARSLLDVLQLKRTLKSVPAFPGVRPVEVTSKRLERIMKLGQGSRKRTPWWCWLVMLAAAAATLPGAAFVVTAGEEPDDATGAAASATAGQAKTAKHQGQLEKELVARIYRVADLLDRIQADQKLKPTEAKTFLKRQLQIFAGGRWKDGPSMAWFGEDLVVRQTKQQHVRIARGLKAMLKYGFGEITFTIKIASGPAKLIDSVSSHWSLMPAETAADEAPAGPGDGPLPLDRPLPGKNAARRLRAQMVVEKNLPMMLEVMSDQRAAQVLEKLQGHADVNFMQAPRVTLFNGQSATIMDAAQRPFVVGLKNGEPQIRVVRDGLSMRLRPILRTPGKVWLDYELSLSNLRRVELTEIKTKSGQEIALQTPEVAKTMLDSSLELPLDKTLLVGGLKSKDQSGKVKSLLVMLRAVKRTSPIRAVATEPNRLMFGAGANSDAGLAGTVIDERNFDLRNAKRRRLAIVGPITMAGPVTCFDPPSDEEVLQVITEKKGQQGSPLLAKDKLKNVRIVKEKIAEYVDPPRFVPMVGPAQLHHAHYKCTIYFTKDADKSRPAPGKKPAKKPVESAQAVIYIDHQHYHLVNPVKPAGYQTWVAPQPSVKFDNWTAVARRRAELAKNRGEAPELRKKIRIALREIPLDEALKRIAKAVGLNIAIDESGLAAAGVRANTPVTLELDSPVSISSLLHLMLEPLRLGFTVKNEVIQVTSEERAKGPIHTKAYHVADLVIPIPNMVKVSKKPGKNLAAWQPDFDSLIDLITTTIEPDSWDKAGGGIQSFEGNLSLVVSQSQEVHRQIAELLNQVRRLRNMQVTVTIDTIRIRDEDSWRRLASDFELHNDPSTNRPYVLSSRESNLMRRVVKEQQHAKLNRGLKVTLFNGQRAEIPISLENDRQCKLELAAVVSADRRSIRIQCQFGAKDKSNTSGFAATSTIPDRSALLLEVTDSMPLGQEDGVPYLSNVPHINRLFKRAGQGTSGERVLLLIQPQILVLEEESTRDEK